MNVLPILNIRSNNKDVTFGEIYRLQFNKKLFEDSTYAQAYLGVTTVISELKNDAVSGIYQKLDELIPKSKFFQTIHREIKTKVNIHRQLNFALINESPLFETFIELENNFKRSCWWFASHLKTEQPLPLNPAYNTFFMYLGEDGFLLNKLSKQSSKDNLVNQANKIILKDKTNKYEPEDKIYWLPLLATKLFIKRLKQLTGGKKVHDVLIDDYADLEKIYDIFEKAVPV